MRTRAARKPVPLEREVAEAVTGAASLLRLGLFERQNTAAFFPEDAKGKRRAVRCGKKGWLDYRFTLPGGRYGEVELKRPGKRPTREQFDRMRLLNAIGCLGFWVDNADDFLEVMNSVIKEGARVRINDRAQVVLYWED